MMGAHVFPKNYSLIESPRTDCAFVWFFAGMNALVFSQGTTISKSFPTKSTAVRPLARMDTYMDLLRAATPEGLAALATWERATAQLLVMRVTMANESSSIWKFFSAFIASYHFVTMRYHMSSQSGFTVKAFRTLCTTESLVDIMHPRMLH